MMVVDEQRDTNPKYWEDAAYVVIVEILSYLVSGVKKLTDMRAQHDIMISKNALSITTEDCWSTNEEMSEFWKLLAAITGNVAGNQGIEFFGFNLLNVQYKELSVLSSEIAELLSKKQRDYGSDNILRFGRFGLLVRVHDKIARLENLASTGTIPNNESVVDNYMDVIGYCTVAIMFERNWFTLPLRKS